MRRSTRIEREIRLLMTSLDPERRVCEECPTVLFNAYGCGDRAQERIRPGIRVLIDLLTEKRSAKGVVIDAVPLDSSGDQWLIGIELETAGNFWGLSDAPLDWLTETERRSTRKPSNEASTDLQLRQPRRRSVLSMSPISAHSPLTLRAARPFFRILSWRSISRPKNYEYAAALLSN
jgi:hypothetical protein